MDRVIFSFTDLPAKVLGVLLCLALPIPSLFAENHCRENRQAALSVTARQTQREVEQQQQQAQEEAQKSLDSEAIAVVKLTRKALNAIDENTQEALTFIEQAAGKLDVLLARHPEKALLPIDYEIDVVNTAPATSKEVQEIIKKAKKSFKEGNYGESRKWLDSLRSEINLNTFYLPLGTYGAAFKEAAHFLDQGDREQARSALQNSLHTVVIIDRIIPIPLIDANSIFESAEEHHPEGKLATLKLVQKAHDELHRAYSLGYLNKEEEFLILNRSIEELNRQIKAGDCSLA